VATGLVIRDLALSFGAVRALGGVSLTVRPGHVHSVIGPNGAGKTTLFNCVSGFLRPERGQVHLDDRDVTGWPPHRLVAAGLARTFQVTNVFGELPVAENVQLAARSRLGRNLDVLRRAGAMRDAIAAAETALEMVGLDDKARLRADQLGHGDRRVLEFALALVLQPRVLLLDEPTAGMSRAETERIAALIRRITAETSVLLVEHDTEMVLAISDEITVMTQGRVIAHGSAEAIAANPEVQAAYLGALEVAGT
jgi:branched-chain amino acid transport system ATP-binding protein